MIKLRVYWLIGFYGNLFDCRFNKAWLEGKEAQIEIFYLPSYSPELNPDEYLNCDLKAAAHSGTPARGKEQLESKARKHMQMLQKSPNRVISYFRAEHIKYAA